MRSTTAVGWLLAAGAFALALAVLKASVEAQASTELFTSMREDGYHLVTDGVALGKEPGLAAYFAGFTPADAAARGTAVSTARADYLSCVVSRAPQKVLAMLASDVEEARTRLAGSRFGPIVWKFAILQDRAENGWPHTHGGVVCLPLRHFASSSNDRVRTLVHEAVHVWQRANPEQARSLILGCEPLGPARDLLPHPYRRLLRSNPDLDGLLWTCSESDGLAAAQIFDTQAPESLAESSAMLFAHEEGKVKPVGYAASGCEGCEHPWETMAYSVAQSLVPSP